jgi:hypothetical protein
MISILQSIPPIFMKAATLALAIISIFFIRVSEAGTPPRQPTFIPKVQSVGEDSITVLNGVHAGYKQVALDKDGTGTAAAAGNVRTYKVKPGAKIIVDGLESDLKAIQPGMLVLVTQDVDPATTSSIVANTVPPAPPKTANTKTAATPAPAKAKGGMSMRSAFRAITEEKVLAVTDKTVTIAQPGAKKARAYRVGSSTRITVNGAAGGIKDVTVGMNISVTSSDAEYASTIDAHDAKK